MNRLISVLGDPYAPLGPFSTGAVAEPPPEGTASLRIVGGDDLLLESGDILLLESGSAALLTALSAMTTPTDDDLVYAVNDPGGTPASNKLTMANLRTYLLA